MSEDTTNPDFVMNPGDKTTILFMQMVFQLSSLATMLLGKAPHPDTGETKRDLEAAQLVIDQLDMLETRTKGNLSREEEQLLKQTLMSLRMAYVEAVNEPAAAPAKSGAETPEAKPGETASTETPTPEAAGDQESTKRFSKKY